MPANAQLDFVNCLRFAFDLRDLHALERPLDWGWRFLDRDFLFVRQRLAIERGHSKAKHSGH
jgi:hypothetical protein